MKIDLIIILIVLFCALLGATGQIFFKLASERFSLSPLNWITNKYLLMGIFLYGLSAILFVWSLRHGNLSVLYPLIATSYIWVALFAYFLLGEPFPWFKWIGILMIILGIGIVVR